METYPGVPSCCDVVGYMSDGTCTGTYDSGASVKVTNFPICHDKDHTGKVKEGTVSALLYFCSASPCINSDTPFDCEFIQQFKQLTK